MLVGDDQIHVSPPAKFPISLQAVDRCQVVWFLAQAVLVKMRNGRVLNTCGGLKRSSDVPLGFDMRAG